VTILIFLAVAAAGFAVWERVDRVIDELRELAYLLDPDEAERRVRREPPRRS
jgi:hypothetical protein